MSGFDLSDFDLASLSPRAKEIMRVIALPLSDGDRRKDYAEVAEELGYVDGDGKPDTRLVRELMKELRAELEAQRDGATLPELSHDDYEALKESIRQYGQLVPVVMTVKSSTVIDGWHRMRICEELGTAPWIVRVSEEALKVDVRDADLIANVVRRHLTATQRRKVVVAELIRERAKPEIDRRTDREIGLAFGMSHVTVAAIRRDLDTRGKVVKLTTVTPPIAVAPVERKTARELLVELLPGLAAEGLYVSLVAKDALTLDVWSDPVQVQPTLTDDGLLELVLRKTGITLEHRTHEV